MSLVMWLPLNGDSKNQGTKQYKETINTLEYTSNGKTTNKCMNSGRLQYDKNPLGMVGSICFWIYPKSTDEGGNGKAQIIFGRHDSGKGERKWTLYMFPDNKSLHSWGCQKDGSKDPNGDFTLTGVLKESAWNHVCVAHDLDYEYVYINGTLKRKIKWDSNGTFTFDVGTPIIYGDFYNDEANYRLNDFRIYDHCLTQSEVSEIAKGLMLHYSFENPYAEETTNIPHSLIEESSEVTFGNDSTGDYVIRNGMTSWSGLTINRISVKPGRYYTWSMEVMSIKDIEYVIDGNMECSNSSHASSNDMHFDIIRGYSHINHKLDGSDTLPKGKLEAYKWTRIYFTVKVKQDCTNPKLFHTFVPYIPSGDSSVKVYYRNSQLEEKPYDTPYTSSKREAGLIRDNSGMGNDGTQVYQRIEIPIIKSGFSTSTSQGIIKYDSTNNIYTITGFNSADNQCFNLGKIKYNSLYHYLGSICSYEFDITLKDLVMANGKILSNGEADSQIQGQTHYKDGTASWIGSPTSAMSLSKRLGDGKVSNATFHICTEKQVTVKEAVTNVDYYDFGLRLNFIKSGTITISNLHAYYQSLDTSTLSLSDNSAIGTHSAYFNGKNYIDIPDMSLPVGDLTISFWGKYDINNLARWGRFINFSEGLEDTERLIVATDTNNRLVFHYVDKPDNPELYTPLNKEGWHLYTWIINNASSKMSLYIDGEFESEKPINVKHTGVLMKENYIGKSSFKLDSNLYGYIDDVRLYSTALSDEDIKALYNVKTRIDNKSNLYCNQLVETKSENMMKPLNEVDLDNDLTKFYSSGTFSYKDGIIKYIISNPIQGQDARPGMYIKNSCYGGRLVDNKRYKYSFWVRVSKKGTYFLGEERIPYVTKSLESGKWYYIEKEGLALSVYKNFVIYNKSGTTETGDTIEIRDVQMYRLYDDKNYNPGPNIKGQYKTFEIDETFNENIENSGATIVDKYGAEWLEVFYHNCKNGTVFFTNRQEALHTSSQYKFSILDKLESFRGADNKFEFLLEYPTDLPNQYLRWKQSDNPIEITDTSTEKYNSNTFASGYELIYTDWNDSLQWSGLVLNNNNQALLDGVVGTNWWYSIGLYNSYTESGITGVPGPIQDARGIVIQKDIHLYVRIDNLPNRNEIFRQYKRQTKTKEIIEI